MLPHALILALLFAGGAEAAAGDKPESWIEVRSPHFRVISNAGDKQARRTAGQFERFREVLRNTLPKARLDSSTPLLIIAVKDEKGLKTLLPQYWEKKGSTHPAGYFLRSLGKDYVVLRLDVTGENPYQVIYHEYTHSLMALNFQSLPLWVSEGLAEFFGHANIDDKDAGTGRPSVQQIMLLRENRLLPLATLLTADRQSPYYNEANKTSMFYAQSWALTHYLMIGDKAVRQPQFLQYIGLVADGVSDLEAAQRSLGDLKKLEHKLEEYIHLARYFFLSVKLGGASDEKQFAAHAVSEAEALAARGDFLMHSQRFAEARPMLEEALRLDANQGLAHESLGFYYFRQGNREEASRHFAAAARLDSANYLAHYYSATLAPQWNDAEGSDSVEGHLRKAIELNAEFAPAYSALAGHYAMRGIKMEDALRLAVKAAQLEPGVLVHHINAARVLLRMERAEEAEGVAQRSLKAARNENDRTMIQDFLAEAARFKEYQAQRKRIEAEAADYRKKREEDARREQELKAADEAAREEQAVAAKSSKPRKSSTAAARPSPKRSTVEGKVAEVTCGPPATILIAVTAGGKVLTFHADNYFKIEFYSTNWKPPENFQPCQHLTGLTLRISYQAVAEKPYVGEILLVEVKD